MGTGDGQFNGLDNIAIYGGENNYIIETTNNRNQKFSYAPANKLLQLGSINGPVDPVAVQTSVNVNASFVNPDTGDTHTATCDWNDGNSSAGTVNEIDKNVTGTHTYTQAGVYEIELTLTDGSGDSAQQAYQFAVIYDPDGGFVTGGGWINSPAGAYKIDPSLAGKASFGFVSKYAKGANVPSGTTKFQFSTAGMYFSSDSYEWLVIAGAKAKFKGSGTINDAGNYGFMLTAIDGQYNRSSSVDKFRHQDLG